MSSVFFPFFLENDLLEVNKILGLNFFKARKDLEGFKTAFFHLLQLSFVLDGLFTTPVYSRRRNRFVKYSAFPHKKIGPKNRSLFMTNKFESKCLQTPTFQVNRKKNGTGRQLLTSSNRAAIFVSTSCEERHNRPSWL